MADLHHDDKLAHALEHYPKGRAVIDEAVEWNGKAINTLKQEALLARSIEGLGMAMEEGNLAMGLQAVSNVPNFDGQVA